MCVLRLIPILLPVAALCPAQSKQCLERNYPRVIKIIPPTLFDPAPFGYSHIAVDTVNAVATVAGQISVNKTGDIVGTTLAEQLLGTEEALHLALRELGANVQDILMLNVYILNFDPSTDLDIYRPTGIRLGRPSSTLISTPALAFEGLLVEIEVSVAVAKRAVQKIACRYARMQ